MPQPGSALNMIMGLEMSEPAGPQGPICHPSRSCAFPYSYLFPRSRIWFSAHGPLALLRRAVPQEDGRFSACQAALPRCRAAVPAACAGGGWELTPRGEGPCRPRSPPAPRVDAPGCRQSPSRACPHVPPCHQLCPHLPCGIADGPAALPGVTRVSVQPLSPGSAGVRCWGSRNGRCPDVGGDFWVPFSCRPRRLHPVLHGSWLLQGMSPLLPHTGTGGCWLCPPPLGRISATSCKAGDALPPQDSPSRQSLPNPGQASLPAGSRGGERAAVQTAACRGGAGRRLAPRRLTARAADSLIDRVA